MAKIRVLIADDHAIVRAGLRMLINPQPDIRVSSAGTAAWYLRDRLGSIRNVVDSSGALIDTIGYDGFGNVTSESSPSNGDRYKFTAREVDDETGWQFNRARYLRLPTGNWSTEDPIGFTAGDANLYRYVDNNPTNGTDPSGLQAEDWTYRNLARPSFSTNKLRPAGYLYRVDLVYPKNRPKVGFFLQLNTLKTVVVTKDGKVRRPYQTKYVVDVDKVMLASRSYRDTNSGPDFPMDWGKDAVFAYQQVEKQHGFSRNVPPEKHQATWTDDEKRAEKFKDAMNVGVTGIISHSYLYANATNYQAAFKGDIDDTLKALAAELGDEKRDFSALVKLIAKKYPNFFKGNTKMHVMTGSPGHIIGSSPTFQEMK